MEFGRKKKIQLSSDPDNKPAVSGYKFEYEGNDFLYVRHLDNTETMAYGDYFFMKKIKDEDGHYHWEYVNVVDPVYSIWSEVIKRYSLEDVFEKERREQ